MSANQIEAMLTVAALVCKIVLAVVIGSAALLFAVSAVIAMNQERRHDERR